jgi:hypothetical protein
MSEGPAQGEFALVPAEIDQVLLQGQPARPVIMRAHQAHEVALTAHHCIVIGDEIAHGQHAGGEAVLAEPHGHRKIWRKQRASVHLG